MQSAAEYLLQLRRRAAQAQHWDWEGTLERSYCRLLPPGATALDVGAHAGRHVEGLRLHAGCARILAVEPQPAQAAYLQSRYAGVSGVEIVTRALGREAGEASFVVNSAAPEESGLRRRHYNDESGAVVENILVEVETVDGLVAQSGLEALHFIKIDVEGAEIDVLEGSTATIQRWRPLIAVEYGSPSFSVYGRSPAELFDQAEAMNYVITDLLGHPCTDRAAWLSLVDAYYWDFLLVPAEGLDRASRQLAAHDWPVPAPDSPPRNAGPQPRSWWQGLLERLRPERTDAAIAAAYRELLGREPDPEGLQHYRGLLRSGQLDVRGMKAQLQQSPERAARAGADPRA